MKLMHLSDLHLGKRVNEFPMLEDQAYILEEILAIADAERVDGVLLAGDVYDKPLPGAEAVALLDDFLVRLADRRLPVFAISGNHDSPERLSFGARLMNGRGVYIAPAYGGSVSPVTLRDEYGGVQVYLLPFVKPAHLRRYDPEAAIESYTDAMRTAIGQMQVDTAQRNVLVAHQFVLGAARCESEDISVGGLDGVDVGVFAPFDYVALGHIHRPQKVGRETVRYCGTPLKYSFSEAKDQKSVTLVELAAKGAVAVTTIALSPKRELRELKGSYLELTLRENYQGTNTKDYLHITLTDEQDIPDAIGRLRAVYPNLMKLDYDNRRTRENACITGVQQLTQQSPLVLLEEFYRLQNNQEPGEEQLAFAARLIEEIWEGAE